jgi:hypothetical protein
MEYTEEMVSLSIKFSEVTYEVAAMEVPTRIGNSNVFCFCYGNVFVSDDGL